MDSFYMFFKSIFLDKTLSIHTFKESKHRIFLNDFLTKLLPCFKNKYLNFSMS